MVIWPACRMGQYRVNDHPYHAPQFIKWLGFELPSILNLARSKRTYIKVFIIALIETDEGVAGVTFDDCFI